ncbi:molybdopterin-dependent oxidoreductase [Chryseobacterium sp. SSA4.19]|uniref:molybdopterin-dependent oxidoreductase n=1 Tax=Chryseobacterium sp. SSA4.19 TaxID=2919915 RepID=UPI001F4D7870|nr:molybdopterin-dependent oxidoreductase [Chryseobacterium sp. SSA4.19]MCJ8154563.1 molybdopterin-dependent oxidoreductase [Chryseobacterium sp. SSA4.19]
MKKLTNLITVVMIALTMLQCKKSDTINPVPDNSVKTAQKHSEEKESHKHDEKEDLKYVSKEVKVTGDVVTPLTLTVDSLKKMKVIELKDFKIVCQTGLTKDSVESTKGVLLTDILEKAKIAQQEHKDRNFYIITRASDDYKATFSWAEFFNSPIGEKAYVVFEQNGRPLKEKGEMIMVSLNDTKTGPRHVKWLKSIEVNRVK